MFEGFTNVMTDSQQNVTLKLVLSNIADEWDVELTCYLACHHLIRLLRLQLAAREPIACNLAHMHNASGPGNTNLNCNTTIIATLAAVEADAAAAFTAGNVNSHVTGSENVGAHPYLHASAWEMHIYCIMFFYIIMLHAQPIA